MLKSQKEKSVVGLRYRSTRKFLPVFVLPSGDYIYKNAQISPHFCGHLVILCFSQSMPVPSVFAASSSADVHSVHRPCSRDAVFHLILTHVPNVIVFYWFFTAASQHCLRQAQSWTLVQFS